MRRRVGPLASAVPARALPAPSQTGIPRVAEPELGEAGNEWGPEGWGRGGADPRPQESEEVGRKPAFPTHRWETEAQPGVPPPGEG